MIDNRGQISLEYMLIFTISLILLIVFTLPLAEITIEDTLDISQTVDVKTDLSKLAQGIKQVYGQGQGAKQTLNIDSPENIRVYITDNYISATLKLKDSSYKYVKVNVKSNLDKSALSLKKGENLIVVEWRQYDDNMIIY